MTVKELIEVLSEMKPDATVYTWCPYDDDVSLEVHVTQYGSDSVLIATFHFD